MTCPKCGGTLYADPQVARDLAVRGFVGSRVRCVGGCTDRTIVEERKPEPLDPRIFEGVTRHLSLVACVCQDCGHPFRARLKRSRCCGCTRRYNSQCQKQRRKRRAA